MKKYLTIIAIAVAAMGSSTAAAQNEFHPQVNKYGYYKVLDCPTSPSYFKATTEMNDDGTYKVNIFRGRTLAESFNCDVTGGDLHYFDANFDGNLDIMVGPATARNYSTILLWSDKKKGFVPMTEGSLNGYFLVNPKTKTWVGMSSDGASITYYKKMQWKGYKLETIESLMVFSDPKQQSEYGVTTKYTLIKGDDYYSPASVGCVKVRTNKLKKLPKEWQQIIDSFNNM